MIEEERNTHTITLPKFTRSLLSMHNLKVTDLDGVVVNHGPGSFTGIRIGIAFAKGLVIPYNIPLYGISTLECFVMEERKTSVAVKALKDTVYFQEFDDKGLASSVASFLGINELPMTKELTTVGISLPNQTRNFETTPNASMLIERFFFKKPEVYSEALYIRPVNAQIPQNMKFIKP